MIRRPRAVAIALVAALLASACGRSDRSSGATVHPALAAATTGADPVALADALERLIEAGTATEADRRHVLAVLSRAEPRTAGAAWARAVAAGRVAELRGLSAVELVAEVERWARRSQQLDPEFRERAATRMLGTLYVLAPAAMLEHGDSETGLELLEGLIAAAPESADNRLRLAEAYLALGDPEPARPHLCWALGVRTNLGPGQARLLSRLLDDAGGAERLGCEAS